MECSAIGKVNQCDMKFHKEFQPNPNPESYQPRTCFFLTADNIDELRLLEKLDSAIQPDEFCKSGFTGLSNDTLIISFPLTPIS